MTNVEPKVEVLLDSSITGIINFDLAFICAVCIIKMIVQ